MTNVNVLKYTNEKWDAVVNTTSHFYWKGLGWGSNPRPSESQSDALTD